MTTSWDQEREAIERLMKSIDEIRLAKVFVPPHMSVDKNGKPYKVDGYWRTGKGKATMSPDGKFDALKSTPDKKGRTGKEAMSPDVPKAAKAAKPKMQAAPDVAEAPAPAAATPAGPKGLAPKPTRASGSMTISFGVVSLPVQYFSATEDGGVKRNRFSPAGNPIKMQNVDSVTGDVVEYGDLKNMYTTEDGTRVELSDEEMAAAASLDGSGTAKVLGVLPMSRLGEYQQSALLQVRPQGGKDKKPSPANQKAFTLLSDALRQEDSFALLQYTSRGKTRAAALTGDGYLRVLAYDDEVRQPLDMPESSGSDAELNMARELIRTMRTDERIDLRDTASQSIRDYAEAKAKGEMPEIKKADVQAGDDLMAALEASLKAVAK